ncbi:MAG: glycine cleavage system protein GcvH [Proteobacteria bacterium]|nr:glycine cleavage system protein GcvH [Pseudomonadota bacterium]
MSHPPELFFSKEHEWTTGTEGEVTIGISSFAIEQLGDVVYIELPEKGDEFLVGESFGTIESTKTVSDLYMPVSGQVTSINEDILADPASLQDDPYIDGWLIKVEANDGADTLMNAEEYDQFIKEEL